MISSSQSTPSKREFWAVFVSLTILYCVAITIGNRRYVWFDELITFNIAGAPNLHQLWQRELKFDCNPPTLYLLSRSSMFVFGRTPLGLRFPSMVEFYCGSMALLFYVRRKVGIAFAAFAVLLLWATVPSLYYAVEARPYSLVFMGFACLLLCWDIAASERPRGKAITGVAVSTFALAVAHVFSPFTLFAFVGAETVRSVRRRRMDYTMWAALILPLLGMYIYLPLLPSCGGIVFPNHATWNTPFLFYEESLGSPVLAIALLAILMIPAPAGVAANGKAPSGEETALMACLFLSPVFLGLFLLHREATFYSRYCLPTQVAVVLTLTVLIAKRTRLSRWAPYAGSLLVFLFILKTQIWHIIHYPTVKNASFLQSIEPSLPIVVTEGQVFMEMNQYEGSGLLARLYFLKDPPASMQYLGTNIFQEFEAPDQMREAGFPFTANIAPYAGFVKQHRHFLLLGTPNQWVFSKLRSEGATVAYAGDYRGLMPYFDTTLYLVTMPQV